MPADLGMEGLGGYAQGVIVPWSRPKFIISPFTSLATVFDSWL